MPKQNVNQEKEKQMRQQLKNNFIKFLLIMSVFTLIKADVYAVNETIVPVSTSYSDALQTANNIKNANTTAASQTSDDKNTTLAHEAVNGTIEQKTQDELDNANSNQDLNAIKKEIKKQTKPRKSYVNIIFKFVLALIWVAISSIIIFIILLSYKKLILKGKPITPTYESTEHSLDTPKNFKEAIKLFLDKTKWD